MTIYTNKQTADASATDDKPANMACARCGMLEKHWVSSPMPIPMRQFSFSSMIDICAGFNGMSMADLEKEHGFWTCPDLYDEHTGRRKEL